MLVFSGFAQEFEVASVKVAPPYGSPGAFRGVGMMGGPGSGDPTRMRYRNFSLRALVNTAYGVPYDQVEGPGWTEEIRYEIIATLPKDATRDQSMIMLRNLLKDRFHLEFHRETRELPVYTLVVAKNGPKLAVSKPIEPAAQDTPKTEPGPLKRDKDGYPILRPGMQMAMVSEKGHPMARIQGRDEHIAQLVNMLSGQLRSPVIDSTGLAEKYDFTLSWVPQPPGGLPPDTEEFGPSIFSAVQEQLGLKLISKKGPVELLVIDRAEKTPTEN
jgi:uncharacterized protein (TIGR03435 family)